MTVGSDWSVTLDVGGVRLAAATVSGQQQEWLKARVGSRAWTGRVAGTSSTTEDADGDETEPGLSLTVLSDPDRDDSAWLKASACVHLEGCDAWFDPDQEGRIAMATGPQWRVEVTDTDIRLISLGHDDPTPVTGGDPAESERQFHDLIQFSLAQALAGPKRMLAHGAAIGRHEEAILVIGPSGSGKSTVAAAALTGGWNLLGDDLAVIRKEAAGSLTVQGVQRTPMFPPVVARECGLVGDREPALRGRTRLPADLLEPARRRLIGVVMVGHDDGDGRIDDVDALELGVVDDCLAVPPFPPVLRRHLAPSAAVLGLPAALLLHTVDADRRLARSRQLLDQLFTRFTALP